MNRCFVKMNVKHFVTLLLAVSFCLSIQNVKSQSLSALYKKSQIQLELSTDYATNNDWQKLFHDADKVEFGKNTGSSKEIVVAPDGSVFMCHKTLYEIWKFDKNGNFIKKFGSKGNKPGQFPFHFSIYGLLDGKYIFTSDCQGRMMFFDTEGNFVKKLQLDYGPLDMVALKGSKIAVLGFVVGKNGRHIVSIKDFNTGQEKIIWSRIDEEMDKSAIVVNLPSKGMMILSPPYTHSSLTTPRLASSKTGNLLLGMPDDGTIIEYSPEGIMVKTIHLKIQPLAITDADINENYTLFVEKSDKFAAKINSNEKYTPAQKQETIKQFKDQLWKMKDRSLYPKHLPYFSSLIIDSDGNILIFEFTKEEVNNKFTAYAYDNTGNKIGTSSFISDTFDLSFIPSNFAFNNGYIYAVATRKNGGKVPLRLVKFKLI
ncbi:MAG: hypothetical protein WCI92_01955 [Bacteroidota bacterium]